MLIVYSPRTSPRLEFILSTLLPAIGIHSWKTTDQIDEYQSADNTAKLNYSESSIEAVEVHIKPVTLLFETVIEKQTIAVINWDDLPAFFAKLSGDIPFDLFATAFYLLSRYEEYLPHKKDSYGRFSHEQSIAFVQHFLNKPLVNLWLMKVAKIIKGKFPSLELKPPVFCFIPTYDIDIAWSYLHKGWIRNIGGLLLSTTEHEWHRVNERLNVLFGNQKDPFDSYEWMDELHKKQALKPVYFFLLADKNKDYDKHILPSKLALQKLIKQLHGQYKTGIHPSWQSGDEKQLLKKEIAVLANLTGEKVTRSRQHYIRMTLPETYQRLIAEGITEDYSMGYGSINGFRASYCLPYKWYDLQQEKTTSLTIYPFCFMDANAFFEERLTAEKALQELNYYFQITKQVNGTMITIWHNHFLGTDITFKGWRELYETALGQNF